MAIRLASITINSGETTVTVNSPAIDLTTLVQNGYELIVDGLSLPLTIVSGGNNSLEIAPEDAPTTTLTARTAKIIQTKAPLGEALTGLESARQVLVDFKDSVSAAADADSIAKRDGSGRVSVATPENNNHAVNKGFLKQAATRDVASAGDTDTNKLMPVGFGGLGTQGTGCPNDDADDAIEGGIFRATSSTANTAITGTSPIIVTRSFNVVPQINVDGNNMWMRRSTDTGATWAPWREIYHSGNTNFDEFGVNAAGDIMARGWTQSATQVLFFLDLNSKVVPTSADPIGTLNVRDANGTDLGNVSAISLLGSSSTKLAVIIATIPDSGYGEGINCRLQSTAATDKIRINF